MIDSKLVFVFFFLIEFVSTTFAQSSERFWVSFTNFKGPKYISVIDAFGSVVIKPFRVSELGHFHLGNVTALSLKGQNTVNYWYASSGRNGQVFLIEINKSNLKTTRFVKTVFSGMLTGPGFVSPLDVTNRGSNNFISFAVSTADGMRVAAFGLDEFGTATGKNNFLTPTFSSDCGNNTNRCKGGGPPDGHLAYWIDFSTPRRSDLFIQFVGPSRHPIGEPTLIDSLFSSGSTLNTFASADITSPLNGNKRYLVYVKQPQTKRASIILQQIDNDNCSKIGSEIVLLKAVLFRNIKVDPKGRFVLFIVDDPLIGSGLAYLALDALGNPSGSPKLLTNLAFSGLDLLREKLN